MPAYWFRFVDSEAKPTGYIGLVVAPDLESLFWQIDEYGDHYMAEIMPTTVGSFCIKEERFNDSGEEDGEITYDEFDISAYSPTQEEKGWIKPNFKSMYIKNEMP